MPPTHRRSFASDERGAVAIMFGLGLVVLVLTIGAAIDTSRAMGAASKISALADATSLATSKAMAEGELSAGDAEQYALDFFNKLVAAAGIQGATLASPVISADPATGSVKIDVPFIVPTTFARAVGINQFSLTRGSTSVQNMKRVELAMVLDVTGSMNSNGKLSALKSAAKDLIDVIIPANKNPVNKIGIVPYSAAVNAGSYASAVSNNLSADGCVFERDGAAAAIEQPPIGGYYFGVAADLGVALDANDHYVCPPSTVLPMTTNVDLLKDTIDGYAAAGWTAGHIGLGWGWYMVSPDWAGIWPSASVGKAYDPTKTLKAVILMTDGEFNTSYANGTANSSSETQTLELCNAMKANDKQIVIFTVAFQAPSAAETLLRSCATSESHYFDAANASGLHEAFAEIAEMLTRLRISQ